jgi:methylmalonyl-CoA mutase
MATNLFEDFDPVSSSNGNKIQFELKGADYNETLIWNSPEDIKVKPYHKDEFTKAFLSPQKLRNARFVKIFLFTISINLSKEH